ncbi:MAG: hypothetical protein LUI14_11420 [Lachnospiraceae bacterium]|nr:hypothetical protein [Lachnospiraceae bacterium]
MYEKPEFAATTISWLLCENKKAIDKNSFISLIQDKDCPVDGFFCSSLLLTWNRS